MVIIAAAAVAIVTAYFVGIKPGMYAGCVSLGLFAVALIIPSLAPIAYLAVAAGLTGVIAVGSKRSHHKRNKRWLKRARTAFRAIVRR